MRGWRFRLAISGAAALFLIAGGFQAARGADPARMQKAQKERTETMKAINQAMREIKVYAGKGDFARVLPAARKVADLVAKIPALSPEGSNLGETRIKPEVWKDFARYKELTEKSVQEARELIQAAEKKDRPATLQAFSDLANSCKACHEPFRLPKKGN
jgi:cytochrome c556